VTPDSAPYRAAWTDRLIDWLERLPVPFWPLIAGLLAFGILFVHATEWAFGELALGQFDFLRATYPCYPIGVLALIAAQRRIARRSLDRFRPASGFDAAGLAAAEREITYQPATLVVWFTLFFGLLGMAIELSLPRAAERMAEVPIAFGIDLSIAFIGYMMMGPWLVSVVRLLRTVNRLHREAPTVDLLNPDPVRAFSSATAFVGFGFAGILTFSGLTDPNTFSSQAGLLLVAITALVAVASFLIPLWGMHARLQAERARMLGQIGRRLDTTLDRLYALVDENRSGATELRDRMLALTAARDLVLNQSSWPWRPETLRWLISALVIPIAIWGVTRLLEGMGL